MKIALVRSRYNAFGGAERFVANALAALRTQQDIQLTIVTRSWQKQPGVDALIVNPFYCGNVWRDWGFARAACRAFEDHPFDLVQSHERLACCDVYRAGDGVHDEWLQQRRRSKGFWGRLSIRLNPYHRYMLQAEKALFTSNQLKAVICNSKMVKEEIQARFDLPESKLHVIYSGVDHEQFSPALRESHRQNFRDRYRIPAHVPVYLFVGSGFERKGVAPFLQALNRLPTDCHGVVVGADKRQAWYENYADKLGIATRVRFTGGLNDVKPAYGAADVFVLPTLYDPFPNAALEAMASGLPIVTSTKSGAAELIQNGVNGYFCDALDIDTLVQAMAALQTKEARNIMGDEARQTVLPFTFDAMSAQLITLYQRLLNATAF